MQTATTITDTFNCSLERAFKTPILGDATKFLTGYLLQPAVTSFEDDKTWAQPQGIRYPVTKGNLFLKKGRTFTDKVLERNENKSWKWTVYDFESNSLFFLKKGIGEWEVKEVSENKIEVTYRYTYHSRNILTQPMNWLFVKIQIRGLMKIAIKGIKKQAEEDYPYVYKT